MGNLGVFEADANAGKLSAEAAANSGFELEKAIDRAIFRARERFGKYLANAESKDEFNERWAQVKPEVIKVIAQVTKPTPGVLRRVGAALRPASLVPAPTKQTRPSSVKADEVQRREAAQANKDAIVPGSGRAIEPKDFSTVTKSASVTASVTKTAWSYDQTTKLYMSNDPMQKFACPGCGTEQEQLGFTKCAGCDRQWNSWPIRQVDPTGKTSAATYKLMAREIKMRGDKFKLAAEGNKTLPEIEKTADMFGPPATTSMPGDNSGAHGAPEPEPAPPAAPEQPPAPVDRDGDQDVAGGVTEDSPIDQIQDALQDAVMALKDVQMLSLNPALVTQASTKAAKVANLRTTMDRFWGLHKQWNYVAGMLAKEASEAIRANDIQITAEAQFIEGFNHAAANKPLPAKTARAWLEGYVAFHRQAEEYSTGASTDSNYVSTGDDETDQGNKGSGFLNGTGPVPANEIRGDSGIYGDQPGAEDFARHMDANNAAGKSRAETGESTSIQPTGSRRPAPKGRR